ncbi:N-acetylmuramoyl-L-alanine amidase [Deinococcus psychrotolerans]|uniref:N-acetylmuramoyl-L-alanine amidase n=1 Tax=Deinococcus psychrotolerans TaxID=2489213 RepID=A0A3G8YET7_9DEIO|nr:N-acetylmuramoyl-L-alanine amidase [Deinococcus psychrotolerans]AZI43380.1 N-acetylmuramoyl-L-alanine amidase [Deinococcus psychrotolerans]
MRDAFKILSSASLLLGALLTQQVAAQTAAPSDPFVRGAPAQSLPGLMPLTAPALQTSTSPTSTSALSNSVSPTPSSNPPSTSRLSPLAPAAAPNASEFPALGSPRVYSEGSQTKVVYDLPTGVVYSLTQEFSGLRLEFRQVRSAPSVTAQLGAAVGEYRVASSPSGVQIRLATPFSLSAKSGWRASEAIIASGGRVLILELGPAIGGGAAASLRGTVKTDPPPPSEQAVSPGGVGLTPLAPKNSLSTAPPISLSRGAATSSPASTASAFSSAVGLADPAQGLLSPSDAAAPAGSSGTSAASQLPPGDSLGNAAGALPAPAVGLPGIIDGDPNITRGKANGSPQAGAILAAPRIGKNPGVTRVVLDLPPGTSFQISPGALGLSIDLVGVGADPLSAGIVSSELRGWRYSPAVAGSSTASRSNVFLLSSSPLTLHSGWRGVLLPPASGSDRSRLAIDFSPAFANTTPLLPAEKVLAAAPPVRSSALTFNGTALALPSVVIDAGHGGRDPGAVGLVTEKMVVLDVALRVRRYLQSAGINVIMSRENDSAISNDKNTDLNARAALGYNGAQLYVSIHANSMEPVNVLRGYGIETWWNNNNAASSAFAGLLQANIIQTTGAYNQGLKSSRSLAVLRGSRVPAALVEIGFVGHPVDGSNLEDDNYLERVALGIARGIREALVTGVATQASK